jgi:alpha-D-xyloside xylohydrolase
MYYEANSKPLECASYTRPVYLPSGTRWYDFWTNKAYEGGTTIQAEADISKIPLFVREGSIIPMTEPMAYTDEKPGAPVTLRIYPGRDASFTLYDDNGDGYGYERGKYRLTSFAWDDEKAMLYKKIVHNGIDKQCIVLNEVVVNNGSL